MKIYVDADACPVKDVIIEIAGEFSLPVTMVCSLSHYGSFVEGIEYIVVDNIPQAADIAIVNKVESGDILITQDYGLAALVLPKGVIALHHTGKRYTGENIDQLLLKRHIAAKIRRGGGKTPGPKAFTGEDKERFRQVLTKVVLQSKQE
ncbi:MAG: YaiI/YqxD family protein [Peptococcaceae bacterium]